MLDVGQKFPDFSLKNQDDKIETLASYAGKWLVVYVYPKDDTPGCTIQGQAFTATKAEFDRRGIHVAGVSADDVVSHKSFCDKIFADRRAPRRPGGQALEGSRRPPDGIQGQHVLDADDLRRRSGGGPSQGVSQRDPARS